MKPFVSAVALLALGFAVVTPEVRGQWPSRGHREPLTKQWQNVQNTFAQALQGFLKVLPGAPGSEVPSSGYSVPDGPSSNYGTPSNSEGSSSYGVPSNSGGGSRPSSNYGVPGGGSGRPSLSPGSEIPSSGYSIPDGPSSNYGTPSNSGGSSSYGVPSNSGGGSRPSSNYGVSGGGSGRPSSSYGNPPRGKTEVSVEKAINSHSLYLQGGSGSSSGSGYSDSDDGKPSAGDFLLPQIVNILEGSEGRNSAGYSQNYVMQPDATPNVDIIPAVDFNVGGGKGYSSSSGGYSNGGGYPSPSQPASIPQESYGPPPTSNSGSNPAGSSGGYSTGSSGGYSKPAAASGSISNPPGTQYGAPLSQTAPSGYSQTEPQYGVPPVNNQIPQGEYGAPSEGGGYSGGGGTQGGGGGGEYGAPSGGGGGGYSGGGGGNSEPQYGAPGLPSPQNEYGSPGQGQFGGSDSSSPQFPPGFGGAGLPPVAPPQPRPPQQIFVDTIASLPEQPSSGYAPPQVQPQQEPEHHNIIFVKAPMPPQFETQVILPPPAQSDTKVYVLTKDVDADDNDIRIVGPRPTAPSKPEVFFVRYAANAPKEPISSFNRAMEDIPPLPQNFDVYAPQMTHSGYNVKKREVPSLKKPKTIYTLRIRSPVEQEEQEQD